MWAELEDLYQCKTTKKFPFSLERGEGAFVTTSTGERYLDMYGGHAVVATGHCHPHVVSAIQDQASTLLFYSNLAYSSIRGKAVEALASVAPEGMKHLFLINSGAEANENAMKIARQVTGRPTILSFEGSFHGRTLGALSATAAGSYRRKSSVLIREHRFAPFGDLEAVEAIMQEIPIAGVLLEPIQSMAGVRMAEAAFYQGLRRLCDQYGACLIYDEVQTGVGRTGGQFFFAGKFGVLPDLITLAKALASGVPIGAVVMNERYSSALEYGDLGTTFGGGPLACAAMLATIEVLHNEGLFAKVQDEEAYLRSSLEGHKGIEAVRGMGFLCGLQTSVSARSLQEALLKRKVITGLSDDPKVLRLLPPLTLTRDEITLFLQALQESLAELGA